MQEELTTDDLENIYALLNIVLEHELVEDTDRTYLAIKTLVVKIQGMLAWHRIINAPE